MQSSSCCPGLRVVGSCGCNRSSSVQAAAAAATRESQAQLQAAAAAARAWAGAIAGSGREAHSLVGLSGGAGSMVEGHATTKHQLPPFKLVRLLNPLYSICLSLLSCCLSSRQEARVSKAKQVGGCRTRWKSCFLRVPALAACNKPRLLCSQLPTLTA